MPLDLKAAEREGGIGGVLYCKGGNVCGHQANHLALADVPTFCCSLILNL